MFVCQPINASTTGQALSFHNYFSRVTLLVSRLRGNDVVRCRMNDAKWLADPGDRQSDCMFSKVVAASRMRNLSV